MTDLKELLELYDNFSGDTSTFLHKKFESLKSKLESQLEDGIKWHEHDKEYCDLKKWRDNNKNLESQIKELQSKSEKWDKFSNQFIATIKDDETIIEPIINKELETENKQLKDIEKRYNLRLHRIVTLEKQNQQYKLVIDDLKKRYDYLNNFKGIRKEWHERTVHELKSILSKLGVEKE